MDEYGFIKVGASVPELKVADTLFNTLKIKEQIDLAISKNIQILVFPELSITGYTCLDLFHQDQLIIKAEDSLKDLIEYSLNKEIIFIVGCPIRVKNKLYNCAVVINNGKLLGIVPKTYIPNYNEFYEARWFSSAELENDTKINLFGQNIPFGNDLIFCSLNNKNFRFAIEICEDLWNVKSKSSDYALGGASILFNLSASNETAFKYDYRKDLIKVESAKTISGYVYASSGVNESSTDLLFSGSSMIFENGDLLEENERFNFESNLIYTDIDVDRLINKRCKNNCFSNSEYDFRKIYFENSKNLKLTRTFSKMPFVLNEFEKRNVQCEEILNILSCALYKRLKHLNNFKCVIGVSGGLDSTLAFLVIKRTFEKYGIDNKNIIAITMPGFGTTTRTYKNALKLISINNATFKEIDIKKTCISHFEDISQDMNIHDITYENAQARGRTQILMDIANKENAIVIGTGDLSEAALGFCTYNGDHMSMYGINSGIPKTLIRYLVEYIRNNDTNKENKKVIEDILNTPISPELIPTSKQQVVQDTEKFIGPYILHDFFLYHFLKYGARPKKIYFLAKETFKDEFNEKEILKWLKVFFKRFFTQQFKRNCVPDGVKVCDISLSPRGDFKMVSDVSYNIFLEELEGIE